VACKTQRQWKYGWEEGGVGFSPEKVEENGVFAAF